MSTGTVAGFNESCKVSKSVTTEYSPQGGGSQTVLKRSTNETYTDKRGRNLKTVSKNEKKINGTLAWTETTVINEICMMSGRIKESKTSTERSNGDLEECEEEYRYDYLGNQTQVIREDGKSNLIVYNALG